MIQGAKGMAIMIRPSAIDVIESAIRVRRDRRHHQPRVCGLGGSGGVGWPFTKVLRATSGGLGGRFGPATDTEDAQGDQADSDQGDREVKPVRAGCSQSEDRRSANADVGRGLLIS